MKQINAKIEDRLHADFKAWCARNRLTIEEALVKAINCIMTMEVKQK